MPLPQCLSFSSPQLDSQNLGGVSESIKERLTDAKTIVSKTVKAGVTSMSSPWSIQGWMLQVQQRGFLSFPWIVYPLPPYCLAVPPGLQQQGDTHRPGGDWEDKSSLANKTELLVLLKINHFEALQESSFLSIIPLLLLVDTVAVSLLAM